MRIRFRRPRSEGWQPVAISASLRSGKIQVGTAQISAGAVPNLSSRQSSRKDTATETQLANAVEASGTDVTVSEWVPTGS